MENSHLNEQQQLAVNSTEGNVRVIAGAGTGKTLVLVNRYAYIVNELGVDPNHVLCLTFTNKAARSFMRMFLSGATECELDKNGRINISIPLTNYAELTKECVIIGVNDRLEIWSNEKFNNFFDENIDNFSEIAENLFNAC